MCDQIISKDNNADEMSIVLSDEMAFLLTGGQPGDKDILA
jgi:hypothetical protein